MVNYFYKIISISFTIVMITTGCTKHVTGQIKQNLQPASLYEAYGIKTVNLKTRSRCALPATVNIINAETRVEGYVVYNPPGLECIVNPSELMNGVVDYLKYGFERSKVQIDSNSSKIIKLSMKDAKAYVGNVFTGSVGGDFQVKVEIPEIKYIETYEAKDSTYGDRERAIAYAIHVVTRQIIDDPNVQDYILCRREIERDVTSSKSLIQKLQELKEAFDKGLMTKDEYQDKRKSILERH